MVAKAIGISRDEAGLRLNFLVQIGEVKRCGQWWALAGHAML